MKTTTKEAIIRVAREFELEPAALLAVKDVESGKTDGFLPDGRPVILFEGHIFYKLLKSKLGQGLVDTMNAKYPNLVYPKWDKTKYKGGTKEWDRLELAATIDENCALKSASWGLFQIMGFNFGKCGCKTVLEYVELSKSSVDDQIRLACNFLKNSGMMDKLRKLDWAGFARAYNGPSYAKNQYDEKLKKAYHNYKYNQNIK